MASDERFVQFVVDQLAGAGPVEARKMFGEFAIRCGSKTVALVCDGQLFMKPTEAGRRFAGPLPEAPPYPGAKPHWRVDDLDDAAWLAGLARATAAELPEPKIKRPKPKPKPAA